MNHDLKCWREPFQAVVDGRKQFEWRRDDRGFAEGDTLTLREWDDVRLRYTGRSLEAAVSYVLREAFGLPDGFVVMSIQPDPEGVKWDGVRA